MTSHQEKIICPGCTRTVLATVEHSQPFTTYVHICECGYLIMASEWNPDTGHTFGEYQVLAAETSKDTQIGGDTVAYPVLGLCNEAGEVAGKIKKLYRDRGGQVSDKDRLALTAELGDVLWYLSETARQLGIDLAEVAAANLTKLAGRAARNTIGGSGDDR